MRVVVGFGRTGPHARSAAEVAPGRPGSAQGGTTMGRAAIVTILALLLPVAPAGARELQTTCRFDRLLNHVIAPADLEFGVVTTGVSAQVTIDTETGRFVVHGSSIDIPPYPMPFADGLDTMTFDNVDFEGTIDAAGNVVVPGVRFVFCTLDTAEGQECAPRNVCADDLSTICIRGAADNGCSPGVKCQGLCAGDRTRSCATTADCAAGDRCGSGTLTPFVITLTTGAATFRDRLKNGEPIDFQTGRMFLTSLGPTPRESPIVQDSGVASLELLCTLAEVPSPAELPSAPELRVRRAKLKFGEGAGDDALTLKATYAPLGGEVPDLSVTDMTIGVGTTLSVCDGNSANAGQVCSADAECVLNDISPVDEAKCLTEEKTLLQLVIPAASLQGNAKRTKFKANDTGGTCDAASSAPGAVCVTDAQCSGGACMRIKPVLPAPGPDDQPAHKIAIKRKGGALELSINSRGLNLDGLTPDALTDDAGNVANVTTRIGLGPISDAAAISTPKSKKKGVIF